MSLNFFNSSVIYVASRMHVQIPRDDRNKNSFVCIVETPSQNQHNRPSPLLPDKESSQSTHLWPLAVNVKTKSIQSWFAVPKYTHTHTDIHSYRN